MTGVESERRPWAPVIDLNSALRNAFNKFKETLGLEKLHFHDLQHFAATEAGNAGASLRDLIARGGWSNERMALRYLHTTKERDRQMRRSGTVS